MKVYYKMIYKKFYRNCSQFISKNVISKNVMKQKNNFYLSVSIQSKEIIFLTLSYLSAIDTRIEFEFNFLLLFSESSSSRTIYLNIFGEYSSNVPKRARRFVA